MAMSINTNYTNYTSGYQQESYKTESEKEKAGSAGSQKKAEASGVVYEKSSEKTDYGTYSINKKSQADRDSIVKQMKADAEQRQQQLMSIVQKTISGQAGAFGKATGDDFWKMISSGNFTVDPATKTQAQKDISVDGYWGVKKTSQRLFDFASALAGDDVEKMKEMQSAIEKGFKMVTKSWGKELPGICKDTFDATNKLFDDYYKSKDITE